MQRTNKSLAMVTAACSEAAPRSPRPFWNRFVRVVHIFSLLSVVFVGFLAPGKALAHTEGKMQLAAVDAGSYKLTAWTSPDPVTEDDEIHVAVAVTSAEDASPVLDADVEIRLRPQAGGPAIVVSAGTEDSENKFLYEAVTGVEQAGAYLVSISVTGSDGQQGDASFTLEVADASGLSILVIVAAALVFVGALVVILMLRRGGATTVEDEHLRSDR